ncbi:MAG: chorismate synthase [bacterium]
MRGNTFGEFFSVTTFGESHGVALGAIIDGVPAGFEFDHEAVQAQLDRRRPGQSAITTARNESDTLEILSGVFEGKTLGTPICGIVRNRDQRSTDYDPNYLRAGHADRVWQEKYGLRDWRGGGRASGRETVSRVIAGAIAEQILPTALSVVAFTRQIGTTVATQIPSDLTRDKVDEHATRCPDAKAAATIEADLLQCKEVGDSRGGVVEVWIDGCPLGLGEPVFRKAKAVLPGALMSIGAVVGVTMGDAVADASASGLSFHTGVSGSGADAGISAAANGLQGGLTNGERIVLRVYFKPASTVGSVATSGRHDPCIVPRAIPVIEAMCSIALADLWLASRLDRRKDDA